MASNAFATTWVGRRRRPFYPLPQKKGGAFKDPSFSLFKGGGKKHKFTSEGGRMRGGEGRGLCQNDLPPTSPSQEKGRAGMANFAKANLFCPLLSFLLPGRQKGNFCQMLSDTHGGRFDPHPPTLLPTNGNFRFFPVLFMNIVS